AFIAQPAARSDKPRPYLIQEGQGICDRGKSCCNDHTFYADDEAIARIPCGLPCRLEGACKLGTKCVHSQEEQPKPSPAESPSYFPISDLPEANEGGNSSAVPLG
ncbi:MAG: hypothetical protein SGPRY_013774, partial [Prymnesium sp.]